MRPHAGDPFIAARCLLRRVVINGFGKSVGLVQVNELGMLETPIALTNTFGVGTVATAQIRAAIAANPRIGAQTGRPSIRWCSNATTAI